MNNWYIIGLVLLLTMILNLYGCYNIKEGLTQLEQAYPCLTMTDEWQKTYGSNNGCFNKTPDVPYVGGKWGSATSSWCEPKTIDSVRQSVTCTSREGNCPDGFIYQDAATYKKWQDKERVKGDCSKVVGDPKWWANPLCDPKTKRENGASCNINLCYNPKIGTSYFYPNNTYYQKPLAAGSSNGNICKSGLCCKGTCVDSTKVTKGATYDPDGDGSIHCLGWSDPRCPDKSKPCPSVPKVGGKCGYNAMTKEFISQGGASPMNCEQFFTKYNCGLQVDTGSVGCLWTPAKSGTPDSGYDTKAYACKMQPDSAACGQKSGSGSKKKTSAPAPKSTTSPVPKSTTSPVPTPKATDVAKSAAPAAAPVPKHVASKMASALPPKKPAPTASVSSSGSEEHSPSTSTQGSSVMEKVINFCQPFLDTILHKKHENQKLVQTVQ